jgi:predicted SAM-dependent methyltransferase
MDVILATQADSSNPAGLVLAPSPTLVKLDLGGGQNEREGFEGVDLNAPNIEHRVDLFQFPWPFADNSVDELHCSHFIEHIPNRDIVLSDIRTGPSCVPDTVAEFVGKDMLFAFFDECWRILKHDGWLHLQWPALRSDRAFQDPTHRRFIPLETIQYMSRDWRKANALDHYRVNCHFAGDLTYIADASINSLHPEAAARHVNCYWNALIDFSARMKAVK